MKNFHIEKGFELDGRTVDLLYQGDTYWMDNGTEETAIHQKVADRCSGKVLVGGLGLGVVVQQLLQNKDVAHIVVVEKEQAVVDLIRDTLPLEDSRLEIIVQGIWPYILSTEERFDYVYLDIVPVATIKSYATISLPLKIGAERVAPSSNIICYEEVKGIDV